MGATYTGNKETGRLLKVSDDINEYPLDVNNQRTSISGLPQSVKDNVSTDPDYESPFPSDDCPEGGSAD